VGGAPNKVTKSEVFSIGSGSDAAVKSGKALEIIRPPIGEPTTVVQARPGAIPKEGGSKYLVTSVLDGDTLKGTDSSTGVSRECRLDRIDTPETPKKWKGMPGQPYGNEAKKTLQDLVANGDVTVKVIKERDKWGRSVCQISVDGADVEAKILEKGLAWLSRTYHNEPELAAIEDKAIKNRTGLWADPVREDPAVYRKRYADK
jgi:endonuclease YncB( thermonuclease family)